MEHGQLTPEDAALWRQADRVLDALLDLPADERHAALDTFDCAEPVRARVRVLLGEAGDAEARMERARNALEFETAIEAPNLSGRRVGRWVLESLIGTGGMSVVYAAHDAQQAHHRVAIKLLAGAAMGAVAHERLQREQRALSRLNHPHIAPLIEAGILDDGTPWIAMGLVEGVRIDSWCFERRLDIAARVRMVIDVAEVVAHAHRALIVHRDLKPGNVLVDADGEVRLLDFGIAGLLEPGAERTLTGLHALTPDYAAPEQFEGASPDMAMDVYGLGALLYRLLTGQPPGRRSNADTSTITPSLAVVETAYSDASVRERAKQTLRGDLDAVLLKALDSDPSRRYAGAGEFGADLRAWLEARPVVAQRPTLRYRVGKFVRRHRGAVSVASIALLGMIGALGFALWQAERARVAAELATLRADDAARESARANAVSQFLIEIFESAEAGVPTSELPTTLDLVQVAEQRLTAGFEGDSRTAARLLMSIGQVNLSLHRLEPALAAFGRAQLHLEALPDAEPSERVRIAIGMANVHYDAARVDAALAEVERAAQYLSDLSQADWTLRELWMDVAMPVLIDAGQLPRALDLAREHHRRVSADPNAMLSHRVGAGFHLGIALRDSGDLGAGLAALEAANADAATLQGHWGRRLTLMDALAEALGEAGRRSDAVAMARRVVALTREAFPVGHYNIGSALNSLGGNLLRSGLHADALEANAEGLRILEQRLGSQDLSVASAYHVRALALAGLGRQEEALQAFARAEDIVAAHLPASDFRRIIIASNRALSLSALGRFDQTLALIAELEALGDALSPLQAATLHSNAAEAELGRGNAVRGRQRADAALAAFEALFASASSRRALALIWRAEAARQSGDQAAQRDALDAVAAELVRIGKDFDATALRAVRERHRILLATGSRVEAERVTVAERERLAALFGPDDDRVRALSALLAEPSAAPR